MFRDSIIPPIKRIYTPILLAGWIILLAILIKDRYFNNNLDYRYISLDTGIKSIPTDSEWMIIYNHGKKLGYAVNSIFNRGLDGYGINSTSWMKTVVAGFEANITLENHVSLDTLFRLESFDFRLLSDQFTTHVTGQKIGSLLKIAIIHGKDTSYSEYSVPEELSTYLGIQPLITQHGIKEGDRIKIPAFDPVAMEMDEVEVIHEGRETLLINGVELELNRIRVTFKGIPVTRWLDDSGLTWREETIMGMMMERTTPEDALDMENMEISGVDLLDVYAIPSDISIRNPSELSELILQFDGIDPAYFHQLDSPRQAILQDYPLQIRFRPVGSFDDNTNTTQYLMGSDIIQPYHPQIIETVGKIINDRDSATEKAEKIRRWVYRTLQKLPVVSLASAVEILNLKKGDCSEHTTLYTSLSRSAGIPTKIHVGLVYLNGKFYYHAWPVVWVDKKWVSIDPTLDQRIADATHIALLETDYSNLSDLVPVLGRISIKVISQTYEKETQ